MTYEEFQHLARLFVVGALDEDEMDQFVEGRLTFGEQGEAFIGECRRLNSMFALSLRPLEPDPSTKQKLLARIRNSPRTDHGNTGEQEIDAHCYVRSMIYRKLATAGRYLGRN